MNKKKETTITEYVNKFVDSIAINTPFFPREIIFDIYNLCGKIPYDGTITRILRKRRELNDDVVCVDKRNSIYARVK